MLVELKAGPLARNTRLVQYVGQDPEKFALLVRHFFGPAPRVAQQAITVMSL